MLYEYTSWLARMAVYKRSFNMMRALGIQRVSDAERRGQIA
ncbi:hypothetical protein ACVIW0_005476 [Bradyrhizobium sp. USDA 4454]